MPPVMGVSAFLMAEFLGRSYFDVVARGYVPALIYYATVAVSVYLLALRHRMRLVAISFEALIWRDWVNLAAFLTVIAGLVGMMAAWHLAPMFAALYVFVAVGSVLFVVNLVPLLLPGRWSFGEFIRPIRQSLDSYTEMTSDLTLLLATLAIMTGALVITGVPTKLGSLLIEAAGFNLAAMVILAFVFGALLGTGLPPAPTYILVAIVIAPPMIRVGVDPWVVHFFAFFLGVWGELTPPTSIVAAVTAKIADASFYETLGRALQICVSLFTLDGRRVHPAGARDRAWIGPDDRGAIDPDPDHRHHLQHAGPFRRPRGDRPAGPAPARGLFAPRPPASERAGGGPRLHPGRADHRLLVAASPGPAELDGAAPAAQAASAGEAGRP